MSTNQAVNLYFIAVFEVFIYTHVSCVVVVMYNRQVRDLNGEVGRTVAIIRTTSQDDSSISLQLYHVVCQHIVGTEEAVGTKLLMNTISDNFYFNDIMARIISGSLGEGLEMKGSDFDVMSVLKFVIVHEDTENVKLVPVKLNLMMEMNDTKPGYTKLRSVIYVGFREMFVQRGYSRYLSSNLFKLFFLKIVNNALQEPNIIHGPCLSDKYDFLDSAACLHNPHCIQPAKNWIRRGHTSWPSSDVKSIIVDHGVLLVPKGSDNEELEWCISFSVAEKLLIYSFSHTQLLCYALMKILLKDVINSNINCKNLLCSYFSKTIIFWVSEETPVTEWKTENLIPCFMKCTRRLC